MRTRLWSLIIQNNLFTEATDAQYEKLFNLAENGGDTYSVSLLIWFCSPSSSFEEVLEIIEKFYAI